MKIKIDERCTQLIIFFSTIMLVLSGVIGIGMTKYCMYAIVALCCVKVIYIRFTQVHILSLILLIFFSFIIVLLYNGSLANWMVFVTSLFFLVSVCNNGISNTTWNLLKFCTILASLYFITLWLTSPSYTEYGQLLLYFDNPNMTGIALSAPIMIIVLMIFENKGKLFNTFNLIVLLTMTYMVYITQNRGSFFSILILIICAVVAADKRKSKRLCATWAWNIIKLTPIVIMFVYIGLFLVLPVNTEFMGKPLFSGRELAWISAIEKIFTNPFAYHGFEEGTLNLFLEGATRYGIGSMIAYFVLIISLRKKKEEIKEMCVTSYLAYVAFHCCLFQQSFESTMLTGSYTVYIWSYLLLGVASMRSPVIEAADKNTEASAGGVVRS